MKNILTALILVMTVYISTCQTTDINLSGLQGIEIYKGLKQGEFLKEIISEKDNQIIELEKQITEDSVLIGYLLEAISNLEMINENNKKYIDHQEKKFELEKIKIRNKRFGISFISGYGFTPDFKNNAFVGIGLSYNIFRF